MDRPSPPPRNAHRGLRSVWRGLLQGIQLGLNCISSDLELGLHLRVSQVATCFDMMLH